MKAVVFSLIAIFSAYAQEQQIEIPQPPSSGGSNAGAGLIQKNIIYCQNDQDIGIPADFCYLIADNFSIGLHNNTTISVDMALFIDILGPTLSINGVNRPMRVWIDNSYKSKLELEALVQTIWATRGSLNLIFSDPRVGNNLINWGSSFLTKPIVISGSH